MSIQKYLESVEGTSAYLGGSGTAMSVVEDG